LIHQRRAFHQIIIRVNPGARTTPRSNLNRINDLARLAPALPFSLRQGIAHRPDCPNGQALAPTQRRDIPMNSAMNQAAARLEASMPIPFATPQADFDGSVRNAPDPAQFVDDVIRTRRTKRGFRDRAVPLETVHEILAVAKYAPSSSNTQPWRCYVLTGGARERVTRAAVAAYRAAPDSLQPEYPFFPQPLHEPYAGRFTSFRGQLGDAQGVPRSDKVGRRRDVERQFLFFDAPVGMIFTMDRRLEWASFICYGCFLQNIMLAARARGLDTCPQQIWSLQYPVLRAELGIPEGEMVIAGMSLGYADEGLPENSMLLPKLGVGDFATFMHD
jgi:nitrobenzene nitroreductase